MSNVLPEKFPCPNCREQGKDSSGDNLRLYDDGHKYCFACSYYEPAANDLLTLCKNIDAFPTDYPDVIDDNPIDVLNDVVLNLVPGLTTTHEDLPERGLTRETCLACGIQVGTYYKAPCYAFAYNQGVKLRIKPKEFSWVSGSENASSMFGLTLFKDYTKPIIITEGEFDMAVCVQLGYQAVSLKSGSQSARKNIEQDKAELLKYAEIWLCFDNDQPGLQAREVALSLLPKNKVKWVELGEFKDVNEAHLAGKSEEILHTGLREYHPEGVLFGSQLDYDALWQSPKQGLPLPWPLINKMLKGLNYGNFYMLFGGSSIGKSSVLRELVYYYRKKLPQIKIANIFLEEDQEVSPLTYLAMEKNIPIGQLMLNRDLIPEQERKTLFDSLLNTDNLMFINHAYKRDSQTLLDTIEWLVTAKKYDIVILDHISYIIGRTASKQGERRDIDELCYQLQDLVKRLGFILVAASHLVDPPSEPGWDEGRVPGLYNGRGSRVLAQVPDGIIGVSRNMKDIYNCDVLKLHNLKNRWFGELGEADHLLFMSPTGRLVIK
jgi:twinkle protein